MRPAPLENVVLYSDDTGTVLGKEEGHVECHLGEHCSNKLVV
jgi:hypothetical protein